MSHNRDDDYYDDEFEDDDFEDEDDAIYESYSELSDNDLQEMTMDMSPEQQQEFFDHVDLQRTIERVSATLPDPNDAEAMMKYAAQIERDVRAHQQRLIKGEE